MLSSLSQKKYKNRTEIKAGRFILATNVLKNLSPSEILTAYKGQQSCERGFKFLKDPLLGASLLGGNLRAGAPLFFALFSFSKIPVKSGNHGVKHGVIFISLHYWSTATSERT